MNTKPMMRKVATMITLMAMMMPVIDAEDAIRDVAWVDLKTKVEFDDPFEKLTEEQLMDLALYARVLRLEKKDGGAKKVNEAMLAEKVEAKEKLRKQGVDADALLARRAEITELRTKRANAGVTALNDKTIRVSGFCLPLEYEGKKVKEFLLVPWVGACIHTPPPAPNQIVHVVSNQPFEIKGVFSPVTVTGEMKVTSISKSLYLVDGKADISMGYSMPKSFVEKFIAKKK
jgi:hypothetical protein